MNAFDQNPARATARIDADGRLAAADPRFAQLNAQAGGALGRPIALPAVATIARLALRLGIVVARAAVVADGDDDVALWVRATPGAEGVALEIAGWEPRDAPAPAGLARIDDAAFDAADADFGWEADAAMCLTALPAIAAAIPGIDAAALLGAPLTRLFALDDGAEGVLPILTAAANRDGFSDQPATVRATGRRVRISAAARRDPLGRFAGFVGTARFAEPVATAAAPVDDDPAFPDAFTVRLERALRTPLARIVAHADSIGEQVDGPVTHAYVEYAHDIASAARHLMGLVDDLVDLNAIERPDFRVDAEPIDLADVARRAGGLLAVRAAAAEVRIDRPDAAETLPATGEFRRALQILVNLIGNAVRYSPPGAMVWLRLERVGPMARIVVADQGKGIAPADQQRIFDKFGRVDPTEPGGSGLGLYIARRLARAMGGDLTVESAPGRGARFTLELPAAD